jgi:hypothetical protein
VNYRVACGFKINFGRYAGVTLDGVADAGADAEGLLYLDWLRGEGWVREKKPLLLAALNCYLDSPAIARALDRAIGG